MCVPAVSGARSAHGRMSREKNVPRGRLLRARLAGGRAWVGAALSLAVDGRVARRVLRPAGSAAIGAWRRFIPVVVHATVTGADRSADKIEPRRGNAPSHRLRSIQCDEGCSSTSDPDSPLWPAEKNDPDAVMPVPCLWVSSRCRAETDPVDPPFSLERFPLIVLFKTVTWARSW